LGNPAIPAAKPHLIIGGKLICRKVIPTLQHVTSVQMYRRYLKTKLNLLESDLHKVDWEVLSIAMKAYQLEDQRRLVLFMNDKLPLRDSKAHPHYGSKLCPSCQRELETDTHLLACTHPSRAALFTTLKNSLTQLTQKLRLHPCILTALWLGLVATRTGSPYPPVLQELPQPVQTPTREQQWLGWEQVYQGRLSTAWAQAVDTLHPTLAPSGTQVMISILKHVWTYVLDIWKLRNQHLHNSANQLNLPDYRQAATTLYELRHQLPPNDQAALYRHPLEHILDQPAPRLQRWVQAGYKYFNQQTKAAKKQAALRTYDIRTFFGTQTQQNDDLQPP